MSLKRHSTIGLVMMLTVASFYLIPLSALAIPNAEGLDVDTIVSDPFAYNGEIKVRGGVLGADPKEKQFWIIDYREYKGCGIVTCALKSMVVNSTGKLPKEKDVVEVKGSIEKNESVKGGFVLKATEVKVK